MKTIQIINGKRNEYNDLDLYPTDTNETVDNVERDEEGIVTMYCNETEKGGLWYMVLSQDLINEIAKFKTE